MPPPMVEIENPIEGIRSARFGHFEESRDAFRDAGWGADYVQLEPGHFQGQMLSTGFATGQISECAWGKTIRHHGLPPAGTIALGVTLSQEGECGRNLGADFGCDDIIIAPSSKELHMVSTGVWDAAIFVLPEALFLQHLAALTRREPSTKAGLARLDPKQGARLRLACKEYFCSARRLEQSADRDFPLKFMAEELTALTIGLIAESEQEPLPRASRRRRLEIFRQAEEYARSSDTAVPRIQDLCRQIKTSERSLRYSFETFAGVSPNVYLKALRLGRVHEALRHKNPEGVRVKSIAYQYGFWHLGQFSQDYRRLFGESPSATLARDEKSMP